jgi:hypothetical protein
VAKTPPQAGAAFLCVTCGTQFTPSNEPPAQCPICTDPRQFVGFDGQQWTTLEKLRQNHQNVMKQEEPGLYSIHTQPHFAIGQRALFLQTPLGNVLWDCVALLDQATIESLGALGGVAAIAISHPHYYTSMVEWSVAFGNAPIHLHAEDRHWVMRPHANIRFWSGDCSPLVENLTLIHTPGHFDGFQVLHWPGGAGGRGVLLSGDQPQVCMDTRWVSFMYSYPNYVPLGARAVRQILETLEPYAFDRIHGAFPRRSVVADAKGVVRRSAERFIQACAGAT